MGLLGALKFAGEVGEKRDPHPVRGEQVGSHYLLKAHRFFLRNWGLVLV